MMCHYYNSWGDETTHTLSCQKRGLEREQKQYMNDRYCVSAFTQITNRNIKREMKAINAVIGHRKGNSSGIVDLYHLLIILEMTIEPHK